ncbi:DNA replication/repair protein RecF [Veillonella sp.]|uniref:DNA replication/repair protein RecF n=2 Tax=Veillonella sp. TaxID=1926307 RepID=UPI001B67F64F|nr:DNA replication/repair protein RecF [Veillonella sp.]MBP8617368.1 DNA replication/repair protein RecF [Veillonella sp.]
MRIDSLQLFQFRNYKNITIKFNPEIIVLHGDNGVGKTNILESIYVGTIGKSHRTNDTADMLMFNADESGIVINFEKRETAQKVNLKLYRKGSKDIRLNDTKISQKELIGTLNTVIFCPEDLQLIKGNPSGRRRFLDMEISQTSATYYHQLLQYNRLLQQRNTLLKEYRGKQSIPLEEWDLQLADMAAFIVKKRLESLKKINLLIDLMNRKLTAGQENLTIGYEQNYGDENTIVYTRDEFYQLLQEALPQDRHRLTTSVGPHRDDLRFFSGAMDLKKYGSQGQQRTAVLSLKLSELEFIKSEVGEYPVLLLDDVLSELDELRRSNLLHFIHKRIQTFITTTDIHDFKDMDHVQFIKCKGGTINATNGKP